MHVQVCRSPVVPLMICTRWLVLDSGWKSSALVLWWQANCSQSDRTLWCWLPVCPLVCPLQSGLVRQMCVGDVCVGDEDLEDVCSCLKGAHTANSGEWQCVSSHCRKLINRTEQTLPLCDTLEAEERPSSCFYGVSKAQLDASPQMTRVGEQGRKQLSTIL